MATFNIKELVAKVLREKPLPASVDDLDESSRRALEDAARRQGITPQALLNILRAQREKDETDGDEAARIARAARSR